MKYAVFDWDNTVRDGYTLFSWINYLCKNKLLPDRLNLKEKSLGRRYTEQEITHDEYADIAWRYYAEELSGLNVNVFDDKIGEYMVLDGQKILPFSGELFVFLHRRDIRPIVVSGAPERIIESYRNRFHLYEIYAVKEETENGCFTGNVEYNHGHEKQRIMEQLIDKYGQPEYGFGDSSSDIPLLKGAKHGVCVYDEQPAIHVDGMIRIRKRESGRAVVMKLIRAEQSQGFVERHRRQKRFY